MTPRETSIAKQILDYLHEQDGHQVHPLTIHAGIGGMPTCGTMEFESVMAQLDRSGYTLRLPTKFKGIMINITDAGEAARLQM